MRITGLLITFLLPCFFHTQAQLCNGSKGDPIVNVTFGTHGGRLDYSETDFEYSGGCPIKGSYTLAALIFGCGDNRSWLTIAGDHTGDKDGNYMLINAESWDGVTTPAIVHRDTATGLCDDVTYVFSAWVTGTIRRFSCNSKAVQANLQFKVTTLSGNLIASFDAGDIPRTEESFWKQYGLAFKLPPGESTAVLSVMTIRKFGCGQGFAIDDITLKPCGPATTTTVNGNDIGLNVCADNTQSFVFQGQIAAGFINPSVQWQSSLDNGVTWTDIPNATQPTYTVFSKDTGISWYRMAVAEGGDIHSLHCRILSNVLYTSVNPVRIHNPPQDVLGCLNKKLVLPKLDPFAVTNLWTGPNGFTSTATNASVPDFNYSDTGLYQLHQTYQSGCESQDSFYVHAFPSTTITVPPTYSMCDGQPVQLNASGDGTFEWSPATGLSNPHSGSPFASPNDTTVYQVTVTNSYGCKDSALVIVYVYENPTANAGSNKTIIRGDSVLLTGSVSGTHINYYWQPADYMSNNQIVAPVVAPPSDIVYTLTAESELGCGTARSSVSIKVYNDVYIPNSFTPNNDGKNDVFRVTGADGYHLKLFQVYNRWGQLIYTGKDFSSGWDGSFNKTPQPQGTYIYILEIESSNGNKINRSGTVTLIR
jgi:gliding motility-associated-like protein